MSSMGLSRRRHPKVVNPRDRRYFLRDNDLGGRIPTVATSPGRPLAAERTAEAVLDQHHWAIFRKDCGDPWPEITLSVATRRSDRSVPSVLLAALRRWRAVWVPP